MKKLRYGLVVLMLLLAMVTSAAAQVSIGIGLPNVSIGINLPLFPEFARVPGYPVYYAPRVDGNYFFYDGMYWVYQDDNWYASSWYNGPWGYVDPDVVPLFILRIPVRYYRQPPVYFRGWQSNAPPRWGHHWGRDWEHHRRGWDRWNRRSVPAPAPLPVYQRKYSGERYPQVEQQRDLRNKSYRYHPRDRAVRRHFEQVERRSNEPAQRGRQEAPPDRSPKQREIQRPAQEQNAPQQRGPAVQERRQQPGAERQEQRGPESKGQERGAHGNNNKSQERDDSQEPNRGHGQGRDRDDDRGRGRDK